MKGPEKNLQRDIHDLILPVEKLRKGVFEVRDVSCPVEHTLEVQGGAGVQSVDPKKLTTAEWTALLAAWNEQAAESMQLWCDRGAPDGCNTVVPLLVSYPPRFRARTGPNGQPPHRLWIVMDITFRCEAAA